MHARSFSPHTTIGHNLRMPFTLVVKELACDDDGNFSVVREASRLFLDGEDLECEINDLTLRMLWAEMDVDAACSFFLYEQLEAVGECLRLKDGVRDKHVHHMFVDMAVRRACSGVRFRDACFCACVRPLCFIDSTAYHVCHGTFNDNQS